MKQETKNKIAEIVDEVFSDSDISDSQIFQRIYDRVDAEVNVGIPIESVNSVIYSTRTDDETKMIGD